MRLPCLRTGDVREFQPWGVRLVLAIANVNACLTAQLRRAGCAERIGTAAG